MAPGYLLAKFDASLDWHLVARQAGQGFRGFIGGEFPTVVEDHVVEEFLARCEDRTGLLTAPIEPKAALRRYRAGEVVRLVGVLGAVSGAVTWADDRGVRIEVVLFNRRSELCSPPSPFQVTHHLRNAVTVFRKSTR